MDKNDVHRRLNDEIDILIDILSDFRKDDKSLGELDREVLQYLQLRLVNQHMGEIKYFIMEGHTEDAIQGFDTLKEVVTTF